MPRRVGSTSNFKEIIADLCQRKERIRSIPSFYLTSKNSYQNSGSGMVITGLCVFFTDVLFVTKDDNTNKKKKNFTSSQPKIYENDAQKSIITRNSGLLSHHLCIPGGSRYSNSGHSLSDRHRHWTPSSKSFFYQIYTYRKLSSQ